MALPRSKEARLFYQASIQRFDDARFLLEEGQRTTAAVYLAGYSVECILKAFILTVTTGNRRAEMLASFRGQRAHSFDWLKEQYQNNMRTDFPRDIARCFRTVSTWTTDMRYRSGRLDLDESVAFLQASETIIRWADGRI